MNTEIRTNKPRRKRSLPVSNENVQWIKERRTTVQSTSINESDDSDIRPVYRCNNCKKALKTLKGFERHNCQKKKTTIDDILLVVKSINGRLEKLELAHERLEFEVDKIWSKLL